jgi:hypothetical protein
MDICIAEALYNAAIYHKITEYNNKPYIIHIIKEIVAMNNKGYNSKEIIYWLNNICDKKNNDNDNNISESYINPLVSNSLLLIVEKCVDNDYINHLLETLHYILLSSSTLSSDTILLSGCLLYNCFEYTDIKPNEINKNVYNLILEIMDDKTQPEYINKIVKLKKAPHLSYNAKMILLVNILSDVNFYKSIYDMESYRHMIWLYCIKEELKGTNLWLEEKLDEIFISEKYGLCFNKLSEMEICNELDRYYESMK